MNSYTVYSTADRGYSCFDAADDDAAIKRLTDKGWRRCNGRIYAYTLRGYDIIALHGVDITGSRPKEYLIGHFRFNGAVLNQDGRHDDDGDAFDQEGEASMGPS